MVEAMLNHKEAETLLTHKERVKFFEAHPPKMCMGSLGTEYRRGLLGHIKPHSKRGTAAYAAFYAGRQQRRAAGGFMGW